MYDRLETNARKVLFLRNFEAEMDDGDNHLHQIRFQRGVVTPPTTLYTMAAQRISTQLTPIHSYDFSHLRNEHQVSAIAFFESHNLASQRRSISCLLKVTFQNAKPDAYEIWRKYSSSMCLHVFVFYAYRTWVLNISLLITKLKLFYN